MLPISAPALGGFIAPLGRPAPQPISPDGSRFDDCVGHRFAVVTAEADPAFAPWLAELGAVAALIRPDRYVAALAHDASGIAALRRSIPVPEEAA
jgi:3-(3-hydroxy-phenyl)propionate hydroxylase